MRPLETADDETVPTPEINTARLLAGPLRRIFGLRVAVALFAGLFLPVLILAGKLPVSGGGWFFFAVLLADFTERYLFFRVVDAPKMPGLPAGTGGRHA